MIKVLKKFCKNIKYFFSIIISFFKKVILKTFNTTKLFLIKTTKSVAYFLKKTYKWILKYSIFLLLVIPYFLCKYVTIDEKYLVNVADIIISLIPMIFTIITISLSLPSEKIYGLTNMEFRKIRKDIYYSFLEMILVTVCIFAFYTIFSILNMVLFVWALDIISILYSIIFIKQEIPILIKNEKTVIKIVKKAWRERKNSCPEQRTKEDKILIKIVQNIVIKNGIVEIYDKFKSKDDKSNILLLDALLSVNNEYFFELSDKIDLIIGTSPESYKGITITEAIDMSFANLGYLLTFNDDFNIVKIFKNTKQFYHLTRLVFNLKIITDKYKSTIKFSTEIKKLLQTIFYTLNFKNIDNDCKTFTYCFLNAITVITISENQLWFIKAIRDSYYNSRFILGDHDEYYYFLSIYFYYLSVYDKRVPTELRNSIKVFINEEADGINSDGSSWLKIFQHQMEYAKYNKLVNLLPVLLTILDKDTYTWYQPKHCTFWSSEDGHFSNSLIIRCWLELLIFNYNKYQFDEKSFGIFVKNLSDSTKQTLAIELNEHWFQNNLLEIRIKEESFLSFYQSKQDALINEDDKLIKTLKQIKTDILLEGLQDEFSKNANSEKDLTSLTQKFIDGFNAVKKNLSFYDEEINLEGEPFVCFDLLFDTRWSDKIIDDYISKFSESFKQIVYTDFKNNNEIKKEIINKNSNRSNLFSILNNYQQKSGNDYMFYKLFPDYDPSWLEKLDRFDLYLPYFTVLNKNSIKMNLLCDEKKSFVRKLSSNEINAIIDRDYKIINGLYKYCESSNDSRSIFITREQIYDIIEKKYFYARIVFKYKIVFNYEGILVLQFQEDI